MHSTSFGASSTVWQIGTFDESSRELGNYSDSAKDPVYVIGQSDPARDWFGFQPGTSNGHAGHRAHPFMIEFDVSQKPQGTYTLDVALLAYTPRLPRLEINLNGHRAWFYQRPKLNYSGGDIANVFLPEYATTRLTVPLPTAFLKQGSNRLVLTAVDEPSDRDDSQAPVIVGNSGIIYDALKLEHDPKGKPRGDSLAAEVIPTVFYKSQGDRLLEVVEVGIRFGERPRRGRVVLTVGKQSFTRDFQLDRDFGEHQLDFEVPEFPAGTPGSVELTLNGRTQRFPVRLDPAKKWQLFVVPHEHLDIGYSDYQAKVAEIQSRVIDEAMDMIREHPDFRFTLDGYWVAQQFLAGRSQEQREKFLKLVRENKIFVPAPSASNATGFATVENLVRSLYGSYGFTQRHGGSFDHSIITDVPSYSWSYASAMAAAGLKYYVAASDNYRAPVLLQGRLHEKSPFWWEGPDGGRILMWYSRHYHQVASLFGLPPQVAAGRESLTRFLDIYFRPDYYSDGVIVYGTQVENTDLYPQQAALVADWSKVYAYPKLRFSGFSEAMDYITRQFGDRIPVFRGDGGPYWEDGLITDAAVTGLARENEQRAPTAEKFATISSLVNPRVRPDRETLDRLWESTVTFDEHTWEADRSSRDPESQQAVRQRAVKNALTTNGKLLLEHILLRSMAAIADFIDNPSGTLVVFNPLNWPRSGLVEVDLDKGLELVDLVTQQTVPYEVLFESLGMRHIRFLASEVPSVGYKCYAMRPTQAEPRIPVQSSETTLENRYYRVVLDPSAGAVKSIWDKELSRELVDSASPYRFNQYIYVTGADDAPNRVLQYGPTLPVPKLEPLPASGGRLLSVTKLPFGTVARLESTGKNTPRIETQIVLFENQKKIGFINRVHKTKVYTKEAVYFAFPFALDKPRFRYETQNGFVDPAKDLLPGAGKEWFSVQHWVAADQDGVTAAIVPVDAHLVTLGDIVRGAWPTEFGERKGTIFSYVMSNYWDTNWPAGQGGEITFRYTLTSGRNLDAQTLSRFGWEEMAPLETNEIKRQDKAVLVPRPLPASQSSFLTVDQPNVALVTWKLAENGEGTILRFLEVGGRESAVTVNLPLLNIESGWKCTAMEENRESLSVSPHTVTFPVRPFEIVTIRLRGRPALPAP
jgi:hypothetical protein